MIRLNCRPLLRFGAVAAALLLALPALADEIEPEPYVEEEAVEPEPEPVVEAEVEEEVESKVAKQPRSVASLPKRSGRHSGRLAALRGPIGGAHLRDTARRVVGQVRR